MSNDRSKAQTKHRIWQWQVRICLRNHVEYDQWIIQKAYILNSQEEKVIFGRAAPELKLLHHSCPNMDKKGWHEKNGHFQFKCPYPGESVIVCECLNIYTTSTLWLGPWIKHFTGRCCRCKESWWAITFISIYFFLVSFCSQNFLFNNITSPFVACCSRFKRQLLLSLQELHKETIIF